MIEKFYNAQGDRTDFAGHVLECGACGSTDVEGHDIQWYASGDVMGRECHRAKWGTPTLQAAPATDSIWYNGDTQEVGG